MDGILIAYYSWGGKTEAIAGMIAERTGGEMMRIETVKPYPEDYSGTTVVAKRELKENARPELSSIIENTERYGTLFLGYPNWWGTMPMALFSFLESCESPGKVILPFCTHGGGGFGRSARDLRRLCPEADVAEVFEIPGSRAESAQGAVDRWIGSLREAGFLR